MRLISTHLSLESELLELIAFLYPNFNEYLTVILEKFATGNEKILKSLRLDPIELKVLERIKNYRRNIHD